MLLLTVDVAVVIGSGGSGVVRGRRCCWFGVGGGCFS